MKINYFDCKYCDYQEFFDGVEETRIYGCLHSDRSTCIIDNKFGDKKYECDIAELLDDE